MSPIPEYEKARQSIEEGDFATAELLGHQMVERGFSGGYEIVAECYFEQERVQDAVDLLRTGIGHAPSVWILHVQLGNYLSELEEYDLAREAYASARNCPEVDSTQVDLNEVILCEREGLPARAHELLEKVLERETDEYYLLAASKHMVRALCSLKRVAEAREIVANLECDDHDKADMLTELAVGLFDAGERQAAVEVARKACALRRAGEAVNIVRLVEGDRSPNAKVYQMVVKGSESGCPFFISYTVVADTEPETMELIKAYDGKSRKLEPESIEHVEDRPGAPKGLVWASGFIFYEE